MIFLSGMHLSVATHLCGGEIAAVKLSFTHENAGCGMCAVEQLPTINQSIESESCCKDQMSFLAVDSNYSPSTLQIQQPVQTLLQVFDIPNTLGILFNDTNSTTNANVQPPGNYIASAVSSRIRIVEQNSKSIGNIKNLKKCLNRLLDL